jgi:hypothetical protein
MEILVAIAFLFVVGAMLFSAYEGLTHKSKDSSSNKLAGV